MKAAKTIKSPEKEYRFSNAVLRMFCAIAIVLNTALALLSPMAGIAGFGFSMMAFLMMFENNRRRFWEQNATARMDLITDDQRILARRVMDNSQDIREIKSKNRKSKSFTAAMAKAFRRPPEQDAMPKREKSGEFRYHAQHYDDIRNNNRNSTPASGSAASIAAPASSATATATATVTAATNYGAYEEHPSYYNALSDTVVSELVNQAVTKEELAVFMQPVMRLPERQVRGYEVFSRVKSRPGQYIPAARYMDIARNENVISLIDHQMLMRCLEDVKNTAHEKRNIVFFINITTATLSNRMFMNRLLDFIQKNRALAARLVFEIAQADFEKKNTATGEILLGLGKLGCTFSIDHTKTMNFDVAELRNFRVRFVKIEAGELLKKMDTPGKINALRGIKRRLESHGVGLIAQKIETAETLAALKPLDMHYGQGYLFGKPKLYTPEDLHTGDTRGAITSPQPKTRQTNAA